MWWAPPPPPATTIPRPQAPTPTTTGATLEKNHQNGLNLPAEKVAVAGDALVRNDTKETAETDALLHQDSPYEEARLAVRNTDGGEVANTVRVWILGMLSVTLGAGLNMFLSMRYEGRGLSPTKGACY